MLALVSAPVFAAKNSDNINIDNPVTVGTKQIPAAEYKVTWNETGSNAQVTLTHGKAVFTLPARVVEQKNSLNGLRINRKDGAAILVGIDLGKVSVEFTSSPSSGQ
jgi:hypothetical protein